MSKQSVFPEDIDDFGVPKTNTLKGEMVDIEDYQYFMSKLPRLQSEQKRLERLQELLINRILMAGDISHYRSAIINIEEYIKELEEEINERLDDLEEAIELIKYNIQIIKQKIKDIRKIVDKWDSDAIQNVTTSCSDGISLVQQVQDQTLFLRGIKGEGRLNVEDNGSCIHISIEPNPIELVVQHVGGGIGTTEIVGVKSPQTGINNVYTVDINEGDNITLKASIDQEGYSFSHWYISDGRFLEDEEITLSNIEQTLVCRAYFEENAVEAGEPIAVSGTTTGYYTQMELGNEHGWVVLEYHNGSGNSDAIEIIYPALSSNELDTNYQDRIIAKTAYTNIWSKGSDGGDQPNKQDRWNFPGIPSKGRKMKWNDEEGNEVTTPEYGFVARQGKLCFYHDPKDGNTRIGIRVKPSSRAGTRWVLYVHPPNVRGLEYGYDLRSGNNRWHSSIRNIEWDLAWSNDPIVE